MSNELTTGSASAGQYPERTSDLPDETVLTLAEAADRLGLEVNSVRRKAKAGQLAGAYKRTDLGGEWRIPVSAVERAATKATATTAQPSKSDEQRAELEKLRTENAVLRALADERGRELEQLHQSFRGLMAGAGPQPADDLGTDVRVLADELARQVAELKAKQEQPPTKRWWRRG